MNRIATILCVLCICQTTSAAESTWMSGTSKVEITPEQPMLMAGYASRDRPTAEVLTKLWCKVCVLQADNGERAVLISLDLVGVGAEFSKLVCRELKARYGLQRDQIAICCSHTHTGPVVHGNLRPMYEALVDRQQGDAIDRYTTATQSKIVNAVHDALGRLHPCILKYGSGEATFATNRRENRPEADVPEQRTAGTIRGPFDHAVPVLAVFDESAETLETIIFGYACHATVLSSYQWSGDYPGFAQAELERVHPSTMAMFWAGCGADQNPLPRRTVALAKHYGKQLATAVDAVLLTHAMQPIAPSLKTQFATIDVPFAEIPDLESWREQVTSKDRFVAARAKLMIEQLENGEQLATTYPYPVGTWQLGGEVQWVFLGGEVVVDYALALKSNLDPRRTWVAAYANDVMAYIPSHRVLREGGYEGGGAMVYYGLPASWAEPIEPLIISTVEEQLSHAE